MTREASVTGSYDRLYVDATSLASLASADLVGVLPAVVNNPRTSYAVRLELEAGIEAGHETLARATGWLRDPLEPGADDPGVAVAGSLVRQRKPELLERLAGSEASVLYQALAANVPLATDDRDVRAVATTYGVPTTGSVGLVAHAAEAGVLSVDEADAALAALRAEGLSVPVDSVDDLLG
jgi:predicted nucleic acid-binding protein